MDDPGAKRTIASVDKKAFAGVSGAAVMLAISLGGCASVANSTSPVNTSAARQVLELTAEALVRNANAISVTAVEDQVTQESLNQSVAEVIGTDPAYSFSKSAPDAKPSVVVAYTFENVTCTVTIGQDPANPAKFAVTSAATC